MWSTKNMKQDGQTDWLIHLYEKVINMMRYDGGLPAETEEYISAIEVPTLLQQARVMRYKEILPPGHNVPTGVI